MPDFAVTSGGGSQPSRPEDAFYYVYRKLIGPPGPDGKPTVVFETIDHAFLECPGTAGTLDCPAADNRVVTASNPFAGYTSSLFAFGLSPLGNFALQSALTGYTYLLWTYDETLPGKPLAGTISGKVLRAKWNANSATDPNAGTPDYEPVVGAKVEGVPAENQGLASGKNTWAITQKDGYAATVRL